MLIQGHKGLVLRAAFDDVPFCGNGSLAEQGLGFRRQELGNHAGNARRRILGHQIEKDLLRGLAVQQWAQVGQGHDGIGLVCGADLDPADQVVAHDRKQVNRPGTQVGAQLFLQDR